MYFLKRVKMTVPIPPSMLKGEDIDKVVLEKLQRDLELDTDEQLGQIIAILDAKTSELGNIVAGSPDIYFDTEVLMLVYQPMKNEIVEGPIVEVTQSEVFVNLGSIDARCTVQNLLADRFRFDAKEKTLRAVRKKITFEVGKLIRAKIIKYQYNIPVIVGPLVRGKQVIAARTIKPKSEIKISLFAREAGLGLISELEKERKEILGDIE